MIFGWWQRPGTEPLDHCAPDHASRLVELRLAKRCMKGFAIQLRNPPRRQQKKFLRIVIHGKSCQMGPRVTEEAAEGSRLAQEAALAYLMIFAGSYCPLIPIGRAL